MRGGRAKTIEPRRHELSKNKFSPSKLTVALGKKVGEVGVKALLTALPPYDSPGLAAEATVSTEYERPSLSVLGGGRRVAAPPRQ